MIFRACQLPFLLTLSALPVPWLSSFPALGVTNWAPELLALFAFIYLAPAGSFRASFKKWPLLIAAILLLQLAGQVLSGQGVGGSAMISAVLMALMFLAFLKTGPEERFINTTIRQISAVYIIHVCFIVVEVLMLNTGNARVFALLSNGNYKPGMPEIYGLTPQSLLKDSQAASELCVFAVVWFALLYLSRKRLGARVGAAPMAALAAALAVFALYPTTTMQVVGLVLLCCVVFLTPIYKNVPMRWLVLIVGIVAAKPLIAIFAYKFTIQHFAPEYYKGFVLPLEVFVSLPLSKQLLGLGSIESIAGAGVEAADLGFLMLILRVGVLLAAVAAIALLALLYRMRQLGGRKERNDPENFPWVWLGSVNALLVLGNVLSLGHYTISLQAGGRALFSFHIAVVMLCVQQLASRRRVSRLAEVAT